MARSQSGLAVGVVVTLAMLAAACTDSVSSITAPSRQLNASNNKSIAALDFTVLANAAVTCTNGTIAGDVGTNQAPPTGSFTQTNCQVPPGKVHLGDRSATAAYEDFLSAYANLTPQLDDVCTIITGDLAGVTLSPGTYCFTAAAALTGTLTLEGSSTDIWIFKVGTSGTGALTGTSFSVVMAGGAQPCNVTWWVAQAATLTDSDFIGTILAGAAITLKRGTFLGNLYSKADVTITGTVVTGCQGSGGGPQPQKCNQGVGNGPEGCDPGKSNNHNGSNDETVGTGGTGGTRGAPGRRQP